MNCFDGILRNPPRNVRRKASGLLPEVTEEPVLKVPRSRHRNTRDLHGSRTVNPSSFLPFCRFVSLPAT